MEVFGLAAIVIPYSLENSPTVNFPVEEERWIFVDFLARFLAIVLSLLCRTFLLPITVLGIANLTFFLIVFLLDIVFRW